MAILELNIRNLVLVRDVRIEFSRGLNIITGETGTGKSLLINGLSILVGEKASRDLIGRNGKSADVSAVFEVPSELVPRLSEMGFEPDDDVLIIRRVLRQSGTRSYINGAPVTRQQLRAVTSMLIDIHGQHGHQVLLDETSHIQFLDRFGKLEPMVREVAQHYRRWQGLLTKLREEKEKLSRLHEMRDFMEYQLSELEEADLREGEDEEISERLNVLTNIEKIRQAVATASKLLYEAEDSAHSKVSHALELMKDAAGFDSRLKEFIEPLTNSESVLSEIGSSLSVYMEDLSYDPDEIEALNARLALINRLKSKYKTDLKGLIQLREKLRNDINELDLGDFRIGELERQAEEAREEFYELALKLSARRREIAATFKEKVEAELAELGMGDARFEVDIQSAEPSESGIDAVRFAVSRPSESGIDTIKFMISTVPGEEPRPLMKIVSGGELSRIMLALKVVLAEIDVVPTLVFDEIDVGISGRIAEAVGRKMKKVAAHRQVIAVTHLPQIAVFADAHFKVEKQRAGDSLETTVKFLENNERVMEIASMLTGEKITDASIQQARELLKIAKL